MNRGTVLTGAAPLAARYPVWLCDIWGVAHDGLEAYPDAVDALKRFRADGGCVVMITNAPRPADIVAEHMAGLGVPRAAYDAIVTSGDATREAVASAGHKRLLHVGPERDDPFFEGLDVELVDAEAAECVVCTGLYDELTEHPDDYEARFRPCVARDLTFYCANPDIVVRRGPELLWCAGALAEVYARLGGCVVITGKPHAPIYARALAAAERARGRAVAAEEVLVIGDGFETDMRGAAAQGFAALFVLDGIHARELGVGEGELSAADGARVERELKQRFAGLDCVGIMRRLSW